jgi:hypothetical protein
VLAGLGDDVAKDMSIPGRRRSGAGYAVGAGHWPGCPARVRRVALRADAGYFAVDLAVAAHREGIKFVTGAKRITPSWPVCRRRTGPRPSTCPAPRSPLRTTARPAPACFSAGFASSPNRSAPIPNPGAGEPCPSPSDHQAPHGPCHPPEPATPRRHSGPQPARTPKTHQEDQQ